VNENKRDDCVDDDTGDGDDDNEDDGANVTPNSRVGRMRREDASSNGAASLNHVLTRPTRTDVNRRNSASKSQPNRDLCPCFDLNRSERSA
jgi:hypothetical protein